MDDYIRPNADLEMKPNIRGKEQLKCMYSECLDGTGEFKDFEHCNNEKMRIVIIM